MIIGEKETFEPLKKIKQKLEFDLMERCVSMMKRKREDENKFPAKKKNLKDVELGGLLDFALDMVSKLESSDEEQLRQMIRLAVDMDEAFVNIWRGLKSQKNECEKIVKFVTLMNLRFDMVSTSDAVPRNAYGTCIC